MRLLLKLSGNKIMIVVFGIITLISASFFASKYEESGMKETFRLKYGWIIANTIQYILFILGAFLPSAINETLLNIPLY